MRRGPLDRYPIDEVLSTAAAEGADGVIEVMASTVGRVYLTRGMIYLITIDGLADPIDVDGHVRVTQELLREHVVTGLASLLEARNGFYHHDPIGAHPGGVYWTFPVAEVLPAARSEAAGNKPLGDWANARAQAVATERPEVRLGRDAWNVLAAMTVASPVLQIRKRSGLSSERLTEVLDELQAAGLLSGGPGAGAQSGHDRPVASPRPLHLDKARGINGSGTRPRLDSRPPQFPRTAAGSSPIPPRPVPEAGAKPQLPGSPPAVVAMPNVGSDAPLPANFVGRSDETATGIRELNGSPAVANAGSDNTESTNTRRSALQRLISSLRA